MSRLDELETFTAIARAGSISRAATQMRVAKSIISRRLAALEARLGVQLINRTTRRMSLTEAGARFLKRAEEILDDIAEAEAVARAGQASLSGKLRIAAPLSFGVAHLQPVVSRFIQENPDLDVEIDFSDRQVDLVEEGFDLAVRIGALTDSTLIVRKVGAVGVNVAATPAFWDAHGRPKTPQALENMPCLQYLYLKKPGSLSYWGHGGEKGAITPVTRMLAGNGEFIAATAADGAGFVVLPSFILEPFLRDGRLETVLENYVWSDMNLYLVYPPTRRISARARAFAEAVIRRFDGGVL